MRRMTARKGLAALTAAATIGAGLVVSTPAATADEHDGQPPALTITRQDLDFVLRQIRVAEAHADGGKLLGPGEDQVGSPLLPYGLRTVTGEDNNLMDGALDGKDRRYFGAADQAFPRLLPPTFRSADRIPTGPAGRPGPGQTVGQVTSYEQVRAGQVVYDAQPRRVSNLVNDQTASNPAALAAARRLGTVGADDQPAPGAGLEVPATAPDAGLSAPFNSWMTFFGQFFDHGLDLVSKGGNGTVLVPLDADDPLRTHGPDGVAGNGDEVPDSQAFLSVTRATNDPGPDGIQGTTDDVHEHTNTTTPYVDQNQTYTSHPSHQVFLREHERVGNRTLATGFLLDGTLEDGTQGGLATWADVKAQASSLLGIELQDSDVHEVPLLLTDPYGRMIANEDGYAQVIFPGGERRSGTAEAPLDISGALGTGHAFLDDIAHAAAPTGDLDGNRATPGTGPLQPDADDVVGLGPSPVAGLAAYDDELLDEHFVTGDGRGNENIALTAVHHVFHSEHNRVTHQVQDLIDAQADDPAFQAEWKLGGGWNGERLFQAGRFFTEMQYQHLVFEEFGRTISPNIDVVPFNESGYHPELDAAISAEFAHVVYRFGHSMLTERVNRELADGTVEEMTLLDAFLDPVAYDQGGALSPEEAAGSLVLGAVQDQGNEIDEFVTPVLRNNLLGLPLDLPTINMVRGRDTGVPGLQAARRTFYAGSLDSTVRPYTSWNDFGSALRNRESLVNLVAAYGTHPTVTGATTLADKRDAATLLVLGGTDAPADRVAFMASSGAWARANGLTTTGLEDVDFWVGGLAERPRVFGSFLGSSFNFVFEKQMEDLQNGDRFYYLSRLIGTNFLSELENNSFKAIIERNTSATDLPMNVFQTPDCVLHAADFDPADEPFLNDPETACDESTITFDAEGNLRFPGEEHITFVGTAGADRLWSGEGDDTVLGKAGADVLEGGDGNDNLLGYDGDDVITDLNGDDTIKGGHGDDAINAGPGLDLILAGSGKDLVVHGSDETESFGMTGDDFFYGSNAHDIMAGGDGDDWLEGGGGTDLLQGDNRNGFQDDPNGGDDVLIAGTGNDDYDAEGGDDIMVAGSGTNRNEGMKGFDWVTHRGHAFGADDDMRLTGLLPPDVTNMRDRFDLVEGLSGWRHDDVLRGDDRGPDVDGERTMVEHELTRPELVDGLAALLPNPTAPFAGGNILLGGAGSDLIEGRGGDDIIDGDAWLNVQIVVRGSGTAWDGRRFDSLTSRFDGVTLMQAVFDRTLSPSHLHVVREIVRADAGDDNDVAVFSGNEAEYEVEEVLHNGETWTVVSHVDGTQADGTDRLRGIEELVFLGGNLPDPVANTPATATFTFAPGVPTEDQAITASAAVVDPDGVPAADQLTFTWQALTDLGWASVGTGASFVPGDAVVGLPLRVELSFTDLAGVPQVVVSQQTAPVRNVNDTPTGQVVLSTSTPLVGQAVTADTSSLADADGIGTLALQWQADRAGGPAQFDDLAGATGTSFTPDSSLIGATLRLRVRWVDAHGTTETVFSTVTAPVPGPLVSLSTAQVNFGGTRVGQQATATVTVSNTGSAPLTVSAVEVIGTDADNFTATGCSAPVPAGASCPVTVRFRPVSSGQKAASLRLAHDAPGSPGLVALRGNGTTVGAQLDAAQVAFAPLATTRTSDRTVTLANTGTEPLTVSSVGIGEVSAQSTGSASQFRASGCVTVLAPGARCTVTVRFAPTTVGSKSAVLRVAHTAGTSSVPVTGTAIQRSSLTAAAPSPVRTKARTSTTVRVTVRNTGDERVSLTGRTTTAPFSITGGTCGTSVAARGTCSLVVTFRPTSRGTWTRDLVVTSTASNARLAVRLSGTGT